MWNHEKTVKAAGSILPAGRTEEQNAVREHPWECQSQVAHWTE